MNDRKSMSEIAADFIDPSTWPLLHNDPTLEEFEFMSQSLELSSVNDEWLSSSDPFSDFNFDNFEMLFADPDFLVANRIDNHNSENTDRNSRSTRNPNPNLSSANPSPTHTNYESDFLATGQDEQQTPSPSSSSREFFSSQTSAPPSPWSQHSSVGSPLSTQPDSPLGLNTSENSFDFRTLLSKSNLQVPVEQTPNKPQPKEKGKRGRPPKKNLDRRIQKGKRNAIISPEILEDSMVRLSHTNHTNTSCSSSTPTAVTERKKRKCMTDEEKKIHNELERRRRAAMSVRLAHLKDSVEKIRDDPKASTKKIVDEAIVAIEDCKLHEQELLIEKQNLADHRRRLKARIQSMENGTDYSFTATLTDMDSGLSEDEHVSVV
ncbi:myc proto-oncogene protein [Octopus sinensis]|uniref:Myc proto-oncogene protein n=1 Tax=Octopus sinensis TaxID=2607531 RepID=A0A6P7SUP9_9MOLL|nr:myc proto-oncogene protein [Octopus sinensis]